MSKVAKLIASYWMGCALQYSVHSSTKNSKIEKNENLLKSSSLTHPYLIITSTRLVSIHQSCRTTCF